MSNVVDEYIERTIREGDKGSKLLAAISAPTLKRPMVDVVSSGMNGIAVLRPGMDNLVVVHSVGGDPAKTDLGEYTTSMVDRLVADSRRIGAEPIGFGDIVDASSMDLDMIATIGKALTGAANKYGLAVMNGELADLGKRVNCPANISGTMISLLPRGHRYGRVLPIVVNNDGPSVTYAIFDPHKQAVFINCDGIGTKTEFYERQLELIESLPVDFATKQLLAKLTFGENDFAAMNLDDTGKLGATARVLSGVIETKGNIPVEAIKERLRENMAAIGVLGILQHEKVDNRIRGYNETAASYNISGSAVSTIDEDRLRNLPHPQEGDYLVAIRGVPNPRSNGITAKRKVMTKLFGEEWHTTPEGKIFLDYLATPSTILYPTFNRLLQNGLATSVFHNSGGAYNGKLARPLAKHELFVDLGDKLFAPDWREVTLAAYSLSTRDSYEKWPMGTDGFVSTRDPNGAINAVNQDGLRAKAVGILEKAVAGRTGVSLKAFNGQEIYFSGKD